MCPFSMEVLLLRRETLIVSIVGGLIDFLDVFWMLWHDSLHKNGIVGYFPLKRCRDDSAIKVSCITISGSALQSCCDLSRQILCDLTSKEATCLATSMGRRWDYLTVWTPFRNCINCSVKDKATSWNCCSKTGRRENPLNLWFVKPCMF